MVLTISGNTVDDAAKSRPSMLAPTTFVPRKRSFFVLAHSFELPATGRAPHSEPKSHLVIIVKQEVDHENNTDVCSIFKRRVNESPKQRSSNAHEPDSAEAFVRERSQGASHHTSASTFTSTHCEQRCITSACI